MSEDLFQYEIINSESLSDKAIKDIHAIVNILSEFYDVAACAFCKNGLIFSAALGKDSNAAYLKAFDSDPVSSFSASVGFSCEIDEESAKHLKSYSIPMVVAVDFSDTAIDILTANSDTILIKLLTPLSNYKNLIQKKFLKTPFGEVEIENKSKLELNKNTFKIATKTKPTTEQIEDAIFAWKISKYLLPINALIAKDFKVLSCIQAQANAQCAIENALNFACDSAKDAVLHISEDILTEGIIHAVAQARVGLIIYSGGRGEFADIKLTNLADKYNIAILTTGINF